MLQLYKLTNTDVVTLETELENLKKIVAGLEKILSDESVLKIDEEGNLTALKTNDGEYGAKANFVYLKVAGKSISWVVYVKEKKFVRGDVNMDEKVNAGDYVAVLNYVRKKITLTDEQLQRADANGDGKINAGDYVTILNIVRGKI